MNQILLSSLKQLLLIFCMNVLYAFVEQLHKIW